MRNVFDQYQQPENRLTHALACCLGEDKNLMRSFLKKIAGAAPTGRLQIVEQQLPGEPITTGDETANGSLPDAWIYGDGDWSLLIEAKVQAAINARQLKRHLLTADRRGYPGAQLLLLSIQTPSSLPTGCSHRHWTEVYKWAISERDSTWAQRLASFMEVTEARMLADGYLKEGTLTAFSGIHFDAGNPYSYREAKRILRLMLDELRLRRSLVKQLDMDPEGSGRGAITGRDTGRVWDFLRLKSSSNTAHTRFPHLTLSLDGDRAVAQLTLPDGLDKRLRNQLKALGYAGFKDLVADFIARATPVLKAEETAAPFIGVVQRHYPTQRSEPIYDARLEFDPRTGLVRTDDINIRFQEEWLKAAYDTFVNKRSNIQVGIGIQFPFAKSQAIRDAGFLNLAEQSYLACWPFLKAMGLV